MSYASILNLYKDQAVLNFPEVFALEKVDGTSSSICHTKQESTYTDNHKVTSKGNFHYHGGGITGEQFKSLFDTETLERELHKVDCQKITIYGESYGGKIQKCADRYGATIKFVAFEVKIDDRWLTVPEAEALVVSLGLEFVHYVRIPTKLSLIDAERDAISEQAIRNGVTTRDGTFVRREGIVLRTIDEQLDHRGNRIMAKHKRAEERETKTDRPVDTAKVEALKEGRAIAEEWVTKNRLVGHVLPKIEGDPIVDMTRTREVISAMLKDIEKESEGEIVWSDVARAEIGKRTAQLLKQYFQDQLREENS